MIGIFRQEETSIYDGPITKVLTGMETYSPEDPEFRTLMEHLESLSEMKAKARRNPLSLDTMAIVGANLVGILIIVAYEQKHVIRTAATGFLLRAK